MAVPRCHHFVPRFYLDRFTDEEGYLFVLDLQGGRIWRQKPQKVFRVRDYYKVEETKTGADPYAFEKLLAETIESHAKIAMSKIPDDLASMTDEDWAYMMIFLEWQRMRVPRQINAFRALEYRWLTAWSQRIPEVAEAMREGKIRLVIKEDYKFHLFKDILAEGLFTKYFSRMTWQIITTSSDRSFITSDSPVCFLKRRSPPPFEAGIGHPDTQVGFPLSPTCLLRLRHPEYSSGRLVLPRKYVIVNQPSEQILVEPGWSFSAQSVKAANCLTASLAARYVAARSHDVLEEVFEEVKDTRICWYGGTVAASTDGSLLGRNRT